MTEQLTLSAPAPTPLLTLEPLRLFFKHLKAFVG